jgi:hypothetical protein
LILHETSVESASGALVTGIAGRDREAAVDRWPFAGCLRPGGFSNRSIESAASLLQELAAPVLRERDGEPDTVCLAVSPGAAVDYAIDAASRDQRWPCLSRSPTGVWSCCNHLGAGDLNPVSRHLELCQIPALVRSLSAADYTDRSKKYQ